MGIQEKKVFIRSYFVLGTIVTAASLLSSDVMYANPHPSQTYQQQVKAKTVKFSLRNDSKIEMKAKAGEVELVLHPGETVAVKLEIDQKVVSVEESPNYPAGTVLSVAGPQLSNATVVLH